jgi:transposase
VDQGFNGEVPKQEAKEAGIAIMVVKLPEAKKGVVFLPRRRIAERSFAWTTRFRRLTGDFERLPEPSAAFTFWLLPS